MTDIKFASMMNISPQTLRAWEKTRPGLYKVLLEYRNKIEHPLFPECMEYEPVLTQKEIRFNKFEMILDEVSDEAVNLLRMQVNALKEDLNEKETLLFDFSTLSQSNQQIVLATAEALKTKYTSLNEKTSIEDACVDEVDLYEAQNQMQETEQGESMVNDLINFDKTNTTEESN